MRRRRWVVVLAVFIVVIVPLLVLGLRVGSRHPAVKRAVLSRIVPDIEGQLSIGELDIGLASLSFGDVVIDLGEDGTVYVPSATVTVSYMNLVRERFAARRAIGSVILSGPRLTLVYGRDRADTTAPFDVTSIIEYLPDYLGISDGTVVLEDASTGRRVEVGSIALLLERTEEAGIHGDAVGSCLGGSENLTAEFSWDHEERVFSVTGGVADATLSDDLPLPAGLPIEIEEGKAWAVFGVSVAAGAEPHVDARFGFDGASIALPGVDETLGGVRGEGVFDGDVVHFSELAGRWRTAAWSAEGAFCLTACDLRGVVARASDVPIEPLVAIAGGTMIELDGSVDLEIGIRGPLDDVAVEIEVTDGSAVVAGVSVEDVRAEGRLTAEAVEVESITASAGGGAVRVAGTVTRGEPRLPWQIDIEGEATDLDATTIAGLAEIDGVEGRLDLTGIEAAGTTERFDLEGVATWRDAKVSGLNLGDGAGGFLLKDGTLHASIGSVDGAYSIIGEVREFPEDPAIDAELTLTSFALDSLLVLPEGPTLPVTLDGTLSVDGAPEALAVQGAIVLAGSQGSASIDVSGDLRGVGAGRELGLVLKSRDASVRGVPVPFVGSLRFDGSGVTLEVTDLAGVGQAHVRVGLSNDHPISGGLVISEGALRDVASMVVNGPAPEGVDGLIFASVSVGGTLEDLEASIQLQIGNGEVRGVRDLDAALVVRVDGGVVELREFALSHGGVDVVTASGSADIDGDLAVNVRGEGIPGTLLGGAEGTRFDLAMGIGGETRHPTFDGRIESRAGEFLGIPFDDFSARVIGARGLARIDPLVLERDGSYRMTATGRLPYDVLAGGDDAEEGSLSIEVDGDPIALLGELTSIAESEGGEGRMVVHLVGGPDGLTIASASLDARAAVVRPVALFDEISDLEARAEIVDGELLTGEVTGLVDGDRLTVASRRGVRVEDRPLESLIVGSLDVGILGISTDPEGVHASVPDLMSPGDVGTIEIRGKDGGPELFIAGPSEHPLIWGELVYSDMSFTYPFPESGNGDGLSFLENADLSLRMIAGRNVWYRRSDASLRLEQGSFLTFLGVPSDGLCVAGQVESTKGTVTYANSDFDVRLASVDFPSFCEPPRFFVEAETRVEDGTTITLTMESIEEALTPESAGVPLDESAIVLSSDAPEDNTRERILSKLQYGVSYDLLAGEEQAAIERRGAIEVIGGQISGVVTRPLVAPIEARMRRNLRLDLVRIEVDFVQHFVMQVDGWSAQSSSSTYVPFLRNTRLTLGKYVSEDWLISYIGETRSVNVVAGDNRLAVRQELGIEYEVSRNTSLSLRVVYDPIWPGWDRRISIENRYHF